MFIAIFASLQEIPQTRMWDIARDRFSLDENGILEIAHLSLDEPVLEAVFFNEGDQGL